MTHLWNKYTREWMDPSLSWPHMYFWNKNLIIYFIFFTSGNEQEIFFFSFSWVRVGEKFWAVICYLYHLMHVQIFDVFIRWGCVILKKIPCEIESIHCHEVLSDFLIQTIKPHRNIFKKTRNWCVYRLIGKWVRHICWRPIYRSTCDWTSLPG